MSAGRCPGCGLEDQSCRVVRTHMHVCADVLEMFRDLERRDRVIDPEDEYRRYRDWLKTDEGIAFLQEQRDVRDMQYKETFESKLARDRERFAHPVPSER